MSFEQISNKTEKIKMTTDLMEASYVRMNGITAAMAMEMKNEVFGGKKIIDQEGHIKMAMFDDVFTKDQIAEDRENLHAKKKEYCGLNDPKARLFREKEYGTTDEEEIIKKHEEKRRRSKPALLESAATILFYKILKERFLVVKSSEWDDYENAADNIIIDKQTGEIVGMFDEVGGEVTGEVKDRGEKKDKQVKIIDKALDGGSNIKYGLTFSREDEAEKPKLIKKSFKNIPIFYLSVKLEDLGDLIDSVGNNLTDGVKAKGLEMFDAFLGSLEAQADLLQGKLGQKENFKGNAYKEGEGKKVSANIDSFRKSLLEMKKLRSKFH